MNLRSARCCHSERERVWIAVLASNTRTTYIDPGMNETAMNLGPGNPPPPIGTGQCHHGGGVVLCVAAGAVCQTTVRMPPMSRRLRKFHGFCAVLMGFTQTTRKAGK